MNTHHAPRIASVCCVTMLAGTLFSCGGHHHYQPPVISAYIDTSLVSDVAQVPAAHTAPKLVNARGMAFNPRDIDLK